MQVAGVRSVIELSKYVIEALGKDKEFNLYRGKSQDDESHVLLLSPVAEYPASETLERLEHEYSLREELDPAWAAQPIAITQQWDRTVLLSEDPGGVPLDQLVGEPLDLAFSLRVAIGLSNVIDRLHQRGLIHKDIKPANVLVNSGSGRCWLKGFGIASRLPRERQSAEAPELVSGTLAYMAPEQTGRMNRSIDSRSDLYSFGVTLYQMLTGSLPFTATDPMEWVHCHIARKPMSPEERSTRIPASLSGIVMKLLAKIAEERYQTAAGVNADLHRCLAEWEAQGRVDDFPLGKHDVPDRLLIPEKLYGRAPEIATLIASFDRVVATGGSELVLVSGYSGIGKSSVVNELQKVLVPPRGLFASGKFDQYKRDIPYSTVAQAFQGLIRPLLGKSDSELSRWRKAFREALGPNGQLIVDLIPELGLILGHQPPVPELPPQDAQRRFHLVFRRFLNVFARPEHPLALFLDDLQWLDAATLDLLEALATQSDVQHLMVIGAYRDNEVTSTHPLMRKLEAIRQAGAIVQELVLASLTHEDLGELISDSLHCERENRVSGRVTALAHLVHEKTGGNPFFAIQFLSALVEEALITFDHSEGRWSWDLTRIHAKGYTANVVDLMVAKLTRLPAQTQKALQLLACLGNMAETRTLSIVHGASDEKVQSDLWEALRLEFVVRSDGSYKFVHDRIQEAAYSLIPEELRAETHLRIGRLLTAQTSPSKLEEAVFEIVSQLNRGALLISSQDERERLAELNLLAGKRAKASTAYSSALKYFIAGAALLPSDCWQSRHELAFALELYRAECEFLTGALASAEERLSVLSDRTDRLVDLATVTHLQEELFTTLGRNDRAIEVCLDYLRHIGVQWLAHPAQEEVQQEYERLQRLIGSRSIEEFIDLPLMTDSKWRATMDVLSAVVSSALFTDKNLHSLVICRMANLSLEHGNCDGSCFAYVRLGMILGPDFGDYRAGFRFGKLGLDLVEQRGLRRYEARVYLIFGHRVIPWTQPIRNGRSLVRRAFDVANRIGDLTFAAYSCDNRITNLLVSGDPLAEVEREAEAGLDFARHSRFGLIIDRITTQLRLIRALRGLTREFGSFNDTEFDEVRFEKHLSEEPDLAIAACWYWIRKLQARFFAGAYASAMAAAVNAERLLWTSPSFLEPPEYHLYTALTRAALCDSASSPERTKHLEALAAHHRQLQEWADNCPENFANRALLAAAEIARIEGRDLDAMRLYEQAVNSAHANGFVHNEALANEVAARFYEARGFKKIAHAYLREARYCYLRWGADGKVRQLDELFPDLRQAEPLPSPTSTIETPIEQLDLATVIKVSQAVSGEIVFEKLINTVMRAAVEQAGAERGLLILNKDPKPKIEAQATTSGGAVVVHSGENVAAQAAFPDSVIQYVLRTRESVNLADASAPNPFSEDVYIPRNRARSILCLPLINQGKLTGVLYLENNLTPHVFTQGRIAVLKLLASQAAISLENTLLYRDLQEREEALRRSQAYLTRAQRLSQTGSLYWKLSTGELGWSDEAFRIMGYDRTVRPSLDLVFQRVHPEDLSLVEQTVDQAARVGSGFELEHRLLMPDGAVKHVHVVVEPVNLDLNNREFVGTIMDISERKLAEEAVRKAQTELAHVSRVTTMGELAASIAHEVNQPLVGVVTNASAGLRYLGRDTPDLGEAKEAIRAIIRDGNRAADVVSRMRAFFKKASPAKEVLNINEAIEEVVLLTQSEARRNKVLLRVELFRDLPSVMADRVQVQQVLMNLILNGIQAMNVVEDRERVLAVRSERGEDDEIKVAVQDCGIGIDPDRLERVFDAFHTTKPGGMGMGLSISRSIVESHGGCLWVTPNDGPGVTFQFTL